MMSTSPDPDRETAGDGVDEHLVARCLDGRASSGDLEALEARLAVDPEFRRHWLDVATIDTMLAQRGQEGRHVEGSHLGFAVKADAGETAERTTRHSRAARPWLSRMLPVAAGIAGVTIGATAAWAMVAPLSPVVIRILTESFETGDAPGVTGVPVTSGVWSGDFTEIVGSRNGVAPASGLHMLRFRRADFNGKPIENGFSCGTHRLIDLRPYRRRLAGGNYVAQVSAIFNAEAMAGNQLDQYAVSAATLDASTAVDGSLRTSGALATRALSYVFCKHVDLDRDASTWQEAVAEIRIPENADFLLVHAGVNEYPPVNRDAPAVFTGHYCDDIRVSLVERPTVP